MLNAGCTFVSGSPVVLKSDNDSYKIRRKMWIVIGTCLATQPTTNCKEKKAFVIV